MKYVLQQIKDTKKMLDMTQSFLREEFKKVLGDGYIVSLHMHYSKPRISVWGNGDKTCCAPSYILHDDHAEIIGNGSDERVEVREAIAEVFYQPVVTIDPTTDVKEGRR